MSEWKPTVKQLLFVEEFCKDMNGSRATRAAGYAGNSETMKLLSNQRILDLINKKLKSNGFLAEPTIPRILTELMRIAFFDPKDLYDDNGAALPLSEIPEDARRCICGIEFAIEGKGDEAVVIKKYKIIDKHKALENLGRHLAMFTDKMKVDVNTQLEQMDDEQLSRTIRQLADKAGISLGPTDSTETKH